ncbi:MAG: Rieske 2Fe-2S domain-containing protein [Thermoplasmata archaeon]|nr:Rieske 2Fe-2S domain-containing protein [Thermoplasmata archaeon]
MEAIPYPGVRVPRPGEAIRIDFKGTPVAVFNVGGELRAIDARCPHRGGPLEKGLVAGITVTCPWHGSQFDLQTGLVTRGPAPVGVHSYPVHVEGDVLVIDAP